jgi:hypothetical protein
MRLLAIGERFHEIARQRAARHTGSGRQRRRESISTAIGTAA